MNSIEKNMSGKEISEDKENKTNPFFDKTKNFANNLSQKTIETAKNIGDKTKNVAIAVGEKTKVISQKTGKKISDTYNDTKLKIEKKKADKKAIEDSKTAQDKVKEQVKLDQMLKDSLDLYNQEYSILSNCGMELYIQRERAVDLILNVEELINSIANHPKSFDTDIQEIVSERLEFKGVSDFATEQLSAAKKSAVGVGSGAAAGVAIASLAPTAAMWIATTFGTASTGAAISSLSGAAATQAALAWIGGGTLAAGGGGVAAGNAFLAMCGPIGWSIAGATILTSVLLFAANKSKLNKQKKEEIEAVKINTTLLKEANTKISIILEETNILRESLVEMYRKLMMFYNGDFSKLSDEDKLRLGTLVNNTKSLAVSLNKTV